MKHGHRFGILAERIFQALKTAGIEPHCSALERGEAVRQPGWGGHQVDVVQQAPDFKVVSRVFPPGTPPGYDTESKYAHWASPAKVVSAVGSGLASVRLAAYQRRAQARCCAGVAPVVGQGSTPVNSIEPVRAFRGHEVGVGWRVAESCGTGDRFRAHSSSGDVAAGGAGIGGAAAARVYVNVTSSVPALLRMCVR